jgi:hypothetical protein
MMPVLNTRGVPERQIRVFPNEFARVAGFPPPPRHPLPGIRRFPPVEMPMIRFLSSFELARAMR